MIEILYLPFLFSALLTAFLTYLLIPLIKKAGLVDDPKIHIHPKVIHTGSIPRGGGIPLFLGVFLSGLLFLPINQQTIILFVASLLCLIVGVIDDKYNGIGKDLSPVIRLGVNILAASIVVFGGISISFLTNPFGGIIHLDTPLLAFLPVTAGQVISIVWIIWVMNMMNWSKGVDQMPGLVAISAFVIGLLAIRLSGDMQFLDTPLSFIIAGAALGFLPFNLNPARIFPGYGATALYLLLAAVSILSSAKLATAILVMGVPTIDAAFTIIRRIANKKSPMHGDRKHLYHLLLDFGYSKRQIALFYWALSAILGVVALTLESKSKLFAIVMVTVITVGGLIFLHSFNEKDS